MEFSLAELRETGKKDLGVSSWMEIDQKRIDYYESKAKKEGKTLAEVDPLILDNLAQRSSRSRKE